MRSRELLQAVGGTTAAPDYGCAVFHNDSMNLSKFLVYFRKVLWKFPIKMTWIQFRSVQQGKHTPINQCEIEIIATMQMLGVL